MLNQMDLALTDEINAQGKKSGNHIAVDGELIAEQSGQHLYIFTLQDPWEPQDDAPGFYPKPRAGLGKSPQPLRCNPIIVKQVGA